MATSPTSHRVNKNRLPFGEIGFLIMHIFQSGVLFRHSCAAVMQSRCNAITFISSIVFCRNCIAPQSSVGYYADGDFVLTFCRFYDGYRVMVIVVVEGECVAVFCNVARHCDGERIVVVKLLVVGVNH